MEGEGQRGTEHDPGGVAAPELGERIPIADLTAEYAEVGAAVEAAVLRVLRSRRYVLGPETAELERELAALVGVRIAEGVGSGTDALWLALRAAGVGRGDEVVTTPFTFFATVEAILLAGATPVFADLEAGGLHVDPDAVEAVLTPRTRAIVPVHLFGRCADVTRLCDIADRRGLLLVEDAAQAMGAARGGRRAGAWGAAGCFSFYPSKNLAAAGDAGCVTTDDAALAERVRLLRHHGQESPMCHALAGTTSRLDSIQAAVLRAKLPFLEKWNEARAHNAALYAQELEGLPDVRLPGVEPGEVAVWCQLALRSLHAERIRRALEAEGVEWRHYYPRPVYREPAWAETGLPAASCPEAERACAEVLALPCFPQLGGERIRRICEVIRRAVEG